MTNTAKKILSWGALKKKIGSLRRSGKKIAFTNGCFDILHYGHVSYLEKAKKNRVLVVGLNSDGSTRRLKGADRPINKQEHRAKVLSALSFVDFVTIFDQDTPQELIEAIKPDILIKGADWKGKRIAGDDVVKKVEFIKFVDGLSTTAILKKIISCG